MLYKSCTQLGAFNGSQLAKMKKQIPYMPLPEGLKGKSISFQFYFRKYDFCEYVKFGTIS